MGLRLNSVEVPGFKVDQKDTIDGMLGLGDLQKSTEVVTGQKVSEKDLQRREVQEAATRFAEKKEAEIASGRKTAADLYEEAKKKKDLSVGEALSLGAIALVPSLLGYAIGGARGGVVGARAGQAGAGKYFDALVAQKENIRGVTADQAKAAEEAAGAAAEDVRSAELKGFEKELSLSDPKQGPSKMDGLLDLLKIQQLQRGLSQPNLTPGQKKVDELFAKDYVEFTAGGGLARTQADLNTLDKIKSNLINADKEGEDYTGSSVHALPKMMRDYLTPKSAGMQDQIEAIIQQNLKKTLGAQFTEREAAAFMARSYNPRLSEQENAVRLEKAMTVLEEMAKAKQAASEFYEKRGSLSGFPMSQVLAPGAAVRMLEQQGVSLPEGVEDPMNQVGGLTPEEEAELKELEKEFGGQ